MLIELVTFKYVDMRPVFIQIEYNFFTSNLSIDVRELMPQFSEI